MNEERKEWFQSVTLYSAEKNKMTRGPQRIGGAEKL